MSDHSRYNAVDIANAIRAANGLVSTAAANMHCSDVCIRNYIRRYKCCQEARMMAREQLKDKAENVLAQKIEAGDEKVAEYYLEATAPERGYGSKPAPPPNNNQFSLNVLSLSNKELSDAIRQLALPRAASPASIIDVGSTPARDVTAESDVVGSDKRSTNAR